MHLGTKLALGLSLAFVAACSAKIEVVGRTDAGLDASSSSANAAASDAAADAVADARETTSEDMAKPIWLPLCLLRFCNVGNGIPCGWANGPCGTSCNCPNGFTCNTGDGTCE
jgi:hypothetical protein